MKSLLIIFFLSFCLSGLSAQAKHFVFIQSDNNQPFYVYLNGKLHSSTASGYIIIPKLTEGNYNFSVGFAKNAFPEQSFQWVIKSNDLGFDLKNFGEKGWGLFNLQSLAVTMGDSSSTNDISKELSEKTSVKEDTDPVISFNRKKKSTVTDQTASKTQGDAIAGEQISKNEKKDTGAATDSSVADNKENKNTSSDSSIANSEVISDKPVVIVSKSQVKKISELKKDDGVYLAYVEGSNKNADTIQIIIPADKSASKTESNNVSSETGISPGIDTLSNKPVASESGTASKDSLKFLDINLDNSKKDIKKEESDPEKNAVAVTNSKCTNIATDEDYVRLRRKMAMAATDEKMINEARKLYRNKCLTTRQIKSLSTLFLSDEGRYNFFNASYNSVTDVSEYSALQSEFIDPAFVDRFKAILK